MILYYKKPNYFRDRTVLCTKNKSVQFYKKWSFEKTTRKRLKSSDHEYVLARRFEYTHVLYSMHGRMYTVYLTYFSYSKLNLNSNVFY